MPIAESLVATPVELPAENRSIEASNNTNSVRIYRLAHHSVVTTILMVWKEWYQGWDGRPSLQQLIETHGNAWRDMKDKKMFSRRKKIITELNKLVEQGTTIEEAIRHLELKRNKMAISTFADTIGKNGSE